MKKLILIYYFAIFGIFNICFNQIDFQLAYSQEAVIPPRSSSVILQDLQNTLKELRELNDEKSNLLNEKLATIEDLKLKNSEVADKLSKVLEEESKANQLIIEQNVKLELQKKWLLILSGILLAFVVLHFLLLILNLKWGIKLPYWLNAIL